MRRTGFSLAESVVIINVIGLLAVIMYTLENYVIRENVIVVMPRSRS